MSKYSVWAIQYEYRANGRPVKIHVVNVSAESEYGAIKRLCGNRACVVKKVELTDKRPEYNQRRIEGFSQHVFSEGVETWEYT